MSGIGQMTSPWGETRVERYWCHRDAGVYLDADGFLRDPAGTWGAAANPSVVSVDALRVPQCVVIVGEPGSGKSETVRLYYPLLPDDLGAETPRIVSLNLAEYGTEDRLARALFEHPEVLAWRADEAGKLCVLLDSLDECKERVSHVATVLGAELARWPTERLYLRICSRTADWPESLQPQLAGLFDDAQVFELLPLRRDDVKTLAAGAGVNGEAFLAAVRAARVGSFAAKPLTLGMLLTIYQRDGRLPDDIAAVYEEALLLLSDEPNVGRRDAGLTGALSAADRVAVATRLAALLTFGHRAAVWMAMPAERPDMDLAVGDCVGAAEPSGAGAVPVTEGAVRETLRTGLFTSRGAGRMGWAHQSYAEYLTARFLVANGLRPKQIRDLLVASDGHVYPQLRPVAAWLITIQPDAYDWLAVEDPELLLSAPVDVPRPALRKRAVQGLLARAANGDYSHRFGQQFGGLAYDGLADDIRPYLFSGTDDQRRLAIDLASDCSLTGLRVDLLQIVLDRVEGYRVRVSAAYALLSFADAAPTTELCDLALAPSGEDDPDDELKGYALRLSWPLSISAAKVFGALTAPRHRNLVGAYTMFVTHEFPDALTSGDVGDALGWLLDVERTKSRHERLDRLADRVVMLALAQLDDPSIAARVAELAVARAREHEGLFVDNISREPKPELTADQRHVLVDAALPLVTDDTAIGLLDHTQYGPRLVTCKDLPWLVSRYDAGDHRETLARLIELTFHPAVPGHAATVLDLPEDHDLRLGPLRYWFEPVDLTSEAAQQTRERWKMVHGSEAATKGEPPPTDDAIEARLVALLAEFDAGETAEFWQACRLVYLRPGSAGIRGGDEFDPDLTAQPRWEVLSRELRSRFVHAARRYLDVGDCGPDAWLGENTLHRPAYAGYRALVLMLHFNEAELQRLSDDVWRRWAPIILAIPTAFGAGRWDQKARLVELARDAAADELFDTATRLVEAQSDRDESIGHIRELGAIWSPRLARWLRDALIAQRFSERCAFDAMALLAKHDQATARPLLRNMLTAGDDAPLRAWAGALLLAHDASESWPALYETMRENSSLGERVVYAYLGNVGRNDAPSLTDQQLADLFIWLHERFPFDTDPHFDDVHAVGPREQAGNWRDRILRFLQGRGTESAVAAISAIEALLPQHSWLRLVRHEAELQARANTWAPVAARDLLSLAAQAASRLVGTAAQLLDVTVDALTTIIQARLTGQTPESHLLWDTRAPRRPKQEDEISDYLANQLRDALAGRSTIVNREVQVRRTSRHGIGERTDIQIDATAAADASVLTLVIEVKGAWHAQLLSAMRDQLVDRYMRDLAIRHGIYLVVWPDLASWEGDHADRRTVARRPRYATDDTLHKQAAAGATEGLNVAVVSLDMAFARPMSKP